MTGIRARWRRVANNATWCLQFNSRFEKKTTQVYMIMSSTAAFKTSFARACIILVKIKLFQYYL